MAKKEKPAKEEAEVPEGEAVEGAEAAEPKKKKLPIMLIAIAAGAVVVLGGGGATAFFLLKPKPVLTAEAKAKEEKAKEAAKKKKEKKGEKKGEGGGEKLAGVVKEGPDGVVFYTMPDLSANMQTQDGRPSNQKLKVTFELPNEDAVPTMEENMPRLQDMFLTFMRELRHEDVAGSQGNYTLRMEIQRRVNLVIAPAKVNAVLVQEMLIQ
jgi:flagellar FliL protein